MNILKEFDDKRHGLLAGAVRPVDKKNTGDNVSSRNSILAQMLEAGGANITAHYVADDGTVNSENITANTYADLCDPNGPNYARKGWLRIDYQEVDGLGYLPVAVASKRYYYDGERIKRDDGTAEKVSFDIEVDNTRYDADKVAKYAIKLRSKDDESALYIADRLVVMRASIELLTSFRLRGIASLGYIDADTYAGYTGLNCEDLAPNSKISYEWEPTSCGWLVVRCNIAIPNKNGVYRDNNFTFDITV